MTAVKSKQLTDNHNMVLQFNLFQNQNVKGKSRRITSSNYESGDIMNNNYVTQEQFSEHKAHMDTRFNSIEKSIENLPKNIINEIKVEFSNDAKTTKRWLIGTTLTTGTLLLGVLGLAGRIFGLY